MDLDEELTRYRVGIVDVILHNWAEGTRLYTTAGTASRAAEAAAHDGPAIHEGHFRRFQQDGTIVAYHPHAGYCDAFGPDEEFDAAPTISSMSPGAEHELMVRLGGECGLRGDEIHRVSPNDVVESPGDSDVMFLEVYGKDSTGTYEEGKYRKTILTRTAVELMAYLEGRRHIGPDDPYITVGRNSLDNWAEKIGNQVADQTGREVFREFTVHDLRRYFATNCLVRHDMNMETVMTVGGWDDYQTMKRYLSITADDQIITDFEEAGLLDGHGWEAPDDEDKNSVYSRLAATTPAGAAAELSALGAEQMAARVESYAEDFQRAQEPEESVGRFTAAETSTAIRAGKYGALVGLVAAALTTSVPAISPEMVMPVATAALLPPVAWGWHRSR